MANKKKLVPASKDALYRMKYEIAAELGLPVAYNGIQSGLADTEFSSELGAIPVSGYGISSRDSWGHLSSRDVGSVGGTITKRLIQEAEKTLYGQL
ncbi:alpha/beta-type small acid-soluble spore protein [Paenibacillus agilis]|uniref:Alpha/beta-type small acid-soluble spore protein n=1 Tax=Paenibacillus agilis TaxID=3020863 RepID=A0A559IPB3_9BACL|nr:alpha/beta-type small acid-soluble spore protein [Paenibacillus agilis]TVX89465.1 alpha/beta-type small acid-soluble spore protein [Paenibacillus agilis]